MIKQVRTFLRLLVDAYKELKRNDPLRLAAATAFFTAFALPPILIILIQLFGSVFSIDNFNDRFFLQLGNSLGQESTEQVRQTYKGFKAQARNRFITVSGVIFLMFVATTLFKIIKDSLNQLWNIKLDTRKKLRVSMEKRLVSMVVIVLAGLLFVAGMVSEGMQALLGRYLTDLLPWAGNSLYAIISLLISTAVVTTWFSILFKVLPDARPQWKVVIAGGFFTGILFSIGKVIIKKLLTLGDIQSVFGPSASIVIQLLFVFYSSFILYYGACFTKVYGILVNMPIEPADHAVHYELVEKRNA